MELKYENLIVSNNLRRRQRDSLYNYIMTMLPSEHIYTIQKFCNEALIEAYNNGKHNKKG